MDAIAILNGVKDRVLDAANYDILKRTYELQNENIKQLETSNTTYKENNEHLKNKLDELKKEIDSLKQTVADLNQKVSQLDRDTNSSELSSIAAEILDIYRESDETKLNDKKQIIPILSSKYSKIQIKSALDELQKFDILVTIAITQIAGFDTGSEYILTEQGKKHIAAM